MRSCEKRERNRTQRRWSNSVNLSVFAVVFLLASPLGFSETTLSFVEGNPIPTKCNAVAAGDLDGDGDLDAFLARSDGRPDEVWINDGGGSFIDSGQRLGDSLALGDLDSD